MLREAGAPLILVDRDFVSYPFRSDLDLVGIDNVAGGYTETAPSEPIWRPDIQNIVKATLRDNLRCRALQRGPSKFLLCEGKDLTKACSTSVQTRHFRGDQFTVASRGWHKVSNHILAQFDGKCLCDGAGMTCC